MKTKFTPGPWMAYSEQDTISILAKRIDGSNELACMPNLGITDTANANLIAAAPELYAALEKLLDRATNDSGFCQSATDYGLANCVALATARAVLAKARGE